MKFAIKKELMFFSRTARMFGVIFGIMIFALADPIMMKGAQLMLNAVGDMAASQGAEIISEEDAAAFSILDGMTAGSVAAGTVGDLCGTASLIALLVLMQPAGGEQKKRSVIIPQCAGLTPLDYITPKFIIYPLTAFLSALVTMPVCALLSSLLFDGELGVAAALAAGAASGLYIAFLIVVELTLGICTGKPGMSAVVTLLAGNLLPTILGLFRVDRFNPFTLPGIAAQIVMGGEDDLLNTWISIGVSVVIGVVLFFLTLFVLNAKKVENEGNEPVL